MSIFSINGVSRIIYRIVSADNGATWGSPETADFAPSSIAYGIAAGYKPGGDLAVFYTADNNVYVKKRINGSWQSSSAWDKTTGELSGLACVYDGDWNLLLTGQAANGDYKLWSLVYGDGGALPAGQWSTLLELATAPSNGEYEYLQPFIDKPDVFRIFFLEKFAGIPASARPFWSHSAPDCEYNENAFREPVPFNLTAETGLAIAHSGGYVWLSCPDGVWRASLDEQSLDLSADVVSVKQENSAAKDSIAIELRNEDGRYALPGEGALAVLQNGCQIDFSPGYVTAAGDEVSEGQSFTLESYRHTSAGGEAGLVLYGSGGWAQVEGWQARHQFRWNASGDEAPVKEILRFVLARAGLKLEVVSQSETINGYYPDFTINASNRGETIIKRLLSFVPDVLFIEGNTAYLINPLPGDEAVYSYGDGHIILAGEYNRRGWGVNRVQVEGFDSETASPVIVDGFDWTEMSRFNDRLKSVRDLNIDTAEKAQQQAAACLRQAEIESNSGVIKAPVNCGQQLYDVVTVTDACAGMSLVRKRVLGIELNYDTRRARYEQRLTLGSV